MESTSSLYSSTIHYSLNEKKIKTTTDLEKENNLDHEIERAKERFFEVIDAAEVVYETSKGNKSIRVRDFFDFLVATFNAPLYLKGIDFSLFFDTIVGSPRQFSVFIDMQELNEAKLERIADWFSEREAQALLDGATDSLQFGQCHCIFGQPRSLGFSIDTYLQIDHKKQYLIPLRSSLNEVIAHWKKRELHFCQNCHLKPEDFFFAIHMMTMEGFSIPNPEDTQRLFSLEEESVERVPSKGMTGFLLEWNTLVLSILAGRTPEMTGILTTQPIGFIFEKAFERIKKRQDVQDLLRIFSFIGRVAELNRGVCEYSVRLRDQGSTECFAFEIVDQRGGKAFLWVPKYSGRQERERVLNILMESHEGEELLLYDFFDVKNSWKTKDELKEEFHFLIDHLFLHSENPRKTTHLDSHLLDMDKRALMNTLNREDFAPEKEWIESIVSVYFPQAKQPEWRKGEEKAQWIAFLLSLSDRGMHEWLDRPRSASETKKVIEELQKISSLKALDVWAHTTIQSGDFIELGRKLLTRIAQEKQSLPHIEKLFERLLGLSPPRAHQRERLKSQKNTRRNNDRGFSGWGLAIRWCLEEGERLGVAKTSDLCTRWQKFLPKQDAQILEAENISKTWRDLDDEKFYALAKKVTEDFSLFTALRSGIGFREFSVRALQIFADKKNHSLSHSYLTLLTDEQGEIKDRERLSLALEAFFSEEKGEKNLLHFGRWIKLISYCDTAKGGPLMDRALSMIEKSGNPLHYLKQSLACMGTADWATEWKKKAWEKTLKKNVLQSLRLVVHPLFCGEKESIDSYWIDKVLEEFTRVTPSDEDKKTIEKFFSLSDKKLAREKWNSFLGDLFVQKKEREATRWLLLIATFTSGDIDRGLQERFYTYWINADLQKDEDFETCMTLFVYFSFEEISRWRTLLTKYEGLAEKNESIYASFFSCYSTIVKKSVVKNRPTNEDLDLFLDLGNGLGKKAFSYYSFFGDAWKQHTSSFIRLLSHIDLERDYVFSSASKWVVSLLLTETSKEVKQIQDSIKLKYIKYLLENGTTNNLSALLSIIETLEDVDQQFISLTSCVLIEKRGRERLLIMRKIRDLVSHSTSRNRYHAGNAFFHCCQIASSHEEFEELRSLFLYFPIETMNDEEKTLLFSSLCQNPSREAFYLDLLFTTLRILDLENNGTVILPEKEERLYIVFGGKIKQLLSQQQIKQSDLFLLKVFVALTPSSAILSSFSQNIFQEVILRWKTPAFSRFQEKTLFTTLMERYTTFEARDEERKINKSWNILQQLFFWNVLILFDEGLHTNTFDKEASNWFIKILNKIDDKIETNSSLSSRYFSLANEYLFDIYPLFSHHRDFKNRWEKVGKIILDVIHKKNISRKEVDLFSFILFLPLSDEEKKTYIKQFEERDPKGEYYFLVLQNLDGFLMKIHPDHFALFRNILHNYLDEVVKSRGWQPFFSKMIHLMDALKKEKLKGDPELIGKRIDARVAIVRSILDIPWFLKYVNASGSEDFVPLSNSLADLIQELGEENRHDLRFVQLSMQCRAQSIQFAWEREQKLAMAKEEESKRVETVVESGIEKGENRECSPLQREFQETKNPDEIWDFFVRLAKKTPESRPEIDKGDFEVFFAELERFKPKIMPQSRSKKKGRSNRGEVSQEAKRASVDEVISWFHAGLLKAGKHDLSAALENAWKSVLQAKTLKKFEREREQLFILEAGSKERCTWAKKNEKRESLWKDNEDVLVLLVSALSEEHDFGMCTQFLSALLECKSREERTLVALERAVEQMASVPPEKISCDISPWLTSLFILLGLEKVKQTTLSRFVALWEARGRPSITFPIDFQARELWYRALWDHFLQNNKVFQGIRSILDYAQKEANNPTDWIKRILASFEENQPPEEGEAAVIKKLFSWQTVPEKETLNEGWNGFLMKLFAMNKMREIVKWIKICQSTKESVDDSTKLKLKEYLNGNTRENLSEQFEIKKQLAIAVFSDDLEVWDRLSADLIHINREATIRPLAKCFVEVLSKKSVSMETEKEREKICRVFIRFSSALANFFPDYCELMTEFCRLDENVRKKMIDQSKNCVISLLKNKKLGWILFLLDRQSDDSSSLAYSVLIKDFTTDRVLAFDEIKKIFSSLSNDKSRIDLLSKFVEKKTIHSQESSWILDEIGQTQTSLNQINEILSSLNHTDCKIDEQKRWFDVFARHQEIFTRENLQKILFFYLHGKEKITNQDLYFSLLTKIAEDINQLQQYLQAKSLVFYLFINRTLPLLKLEDRPELTIENKLKISWKMASFFYSALPGANRANLSNILEEFFSISAKEVEKNSGLQKHLIETTREIFAEWKGKNNAGGIEKSSRSCDRLMFYQRVLLERAVDETTVEDYLDAHVCFLKEAKDPSRVFVVIKDFLCNRLWRFDSPGSVENKMLAWMRTAERRGLFSEVTLDTLYPQFFYTLLDKKTERDFSSSFASNGVLFHALIELHTSLWEERTPRRLGIIYRFWDTYLPCFFKKEQKKVLIEWIKALFLSIQTMQETTQYDANIVIAPHMCILFKIKNLEWIDSIYETFEEKKEFYFVLARSALCFKHEDENYLCAKSNTLFSIFVEKELFTNDREELRPWFEIIKETAKAHPTYERVYTRLLACASAQIVKMRVVVREPQKQETLFLFEQTINKEYQKNDPSAQDPLDLALYEIEEKRSAEYSLDINHRPDQTEKNSSVTLDRELFFRLPDLAQSASKDEDFAQLHACIQLQSVGNLEKKEQAQLLSSICRNLSTSEKYLEFLCDVVKQLADSKRFDTDTFVEPSLLETYLDKISSLIEKIADPHPFIELLLHLVPNVLIESPQRERKIETCLRQFIRRNGQENNLMVERDLWKRYSRKMRGEPTLANFIKLVEQFKWVNFFGAAILEWAETAIPRDEVKKIASQLIQQRKECFDQGRQSSEAKRFLVHVRSFLFQAFPNLQRLGIWKECFSPMEIALNTLKNGDKTIQKDPVFQTLFFFLTEKPEYPKITNPYEKTKKILYAMTYNKVDTLWNSIELPRDPDWKIYFLRNFIRNHFSGVVEEAKSEMPSIIEKWIAITEGLDPFHLVLRRILLCELVAFQNKFTKSTQEKLKNRREELEKNWTNEAAQLLTRLRLEEYSFRNTIQERKNL